MKNFNTLIYASALMVLTSCATTNSYIQIAQTLPEKPETFQVDKRGQYYYQDENCKIVFDLWGDGGISKFVVYNLSDEALVLCSTECLITRNGLTNNMFTQVPNEAIAPHAYRSFSGLNLGFKRFLDCDFSIFPAHNNPSTWSFDQSSSPENYRFYINYRKSVSGEKRGLDFAFYISRVTNYLRDDIVTYTMEKIKTTHCDNIPQSTTSSFDKKQYKYIFSPATGFYVTYTATKK